MIMERDEKQAIEEIVKLFMNIPQHRFPEGFRYRPYVLAEVLYNADYRKQSVGEWKDQYNGKYANPIYVCSVCGKGTLLRPYINELNNMEMIQALSPYCPNCGAKMKGGRE